MNWRIYIITHGPIIEDYYKNDPLFSLENFVFFNVSNTPIVGHDKYRIINKSDVKGFIHLGKQYAEAEVIYNIYKNGLYKECDYVGFIHWDHELKSLDELINYNITGAVNNLIENKELGGDSIISFYERNFYDDFRQKIMMDEKYLSVLTGNGKNCYETIITEYNEYFNDNISIDSLKETKINLCSAFLCSKENFYKLMKFYCFIIEKGYLDRFDPENRYRFQGGMMERYVGIFFNHFRLLSIPLIHHTRKNYLKPLKHILYKYIFRFFNK